MDRLGEISTQLGKKHRHADSSHPQSRTLQQYSKIKEPENHNMEHKWHVIQMTNRKEFNTSSPNDNIKSCSYKRIATPKK